MKDHQCPGGCENEQEHADYVASVAVIVNAYHEKVGYWHLFIVSEGQRFEWFVFHGDVRISGSVPHTEGFAHARKRAKEAIHRKNAQAVMTKPHVCCSCTLQEDGKSGDCCNEGHPRKPVAAQPDSESHPGYMEGPTR